jgi:penicillin-binding protein 1A
MIGIDSDTISSDHPQGALVAVDTNTGAVRALVGGRNYLRTEYNRALQHNRLPGSGFKPFLYYAAFEKIGLNPASRYVDRPVTIPVRGNRDWKPQNFKRNNAGAMVLKSALIKSVNTIAAQLVEKVGPENVIEVARRCGIKSRLDPVFSVALGTSGVSPLEMASAFATFATGGIRHEPFFIRRIEDAQGRVLEEHIVGGKRVLDKRFAYQVVDMMRGVIDAGTGAVVRRMGFNLPAAGKTGTTDNYYDAWFTAFTPALSTSVWVGYDHGKPLRSINRVGITGGRAAAPIWTEFMLKATAGEPRRDFIKPDDIRFETVDPVDGCQASISDTGSIRVALAKNQKVCETFSETDKKSF